MTFTTASSTEIPIILTNTASGEMSTMFVLYDGRAKTGDTDDASVLDTADTEAEARCAGRTAWQDYDAIWYEYEQRGDRLMAGKARWDLPPVGES
jgi:hypothetical protein